jgi:hypothetical protein
MKTLKYKGQLLLAFISICAITLSCKKALNLTPTTEYASSKYFESSSQAYAVLYGAYYQLQVVINQEFIYYGESRSDNVTVGGGSINNNTLSVINNDLDGNLSYSDWGNFYAVIKQANLLIENVPLMREKGITVRDVDYNKLLGQAYGLRALAYFYLVRIWGDVPLVVKPVQNESDINAFKTPRVSKEIIYQQISTDLILARSLLPTTNSTSEETRAMLTRGAIDAMQTDYYMWRNMPDSAVITSARLIATNGDPVYATYKLVELATPALIANPALIDNAPFSKIFTEGFSEESIFEVAFSFDENNLSNIFGIYGNVNAQFFAGGYLLNSFEDNDLRALATFRSVYQIYKFFPKTGFDQSTQNDKNVIIYRLADVMLLRAEALNEASRRADAFLLVNKIRTRAGVSPITATVFNGYTKEQAQDFILEERQRELCFEGKRWFDLVRTGKAIQVMQPINGLSDVNNLVWPISLKIIRQNQLIEQNEFYK